MEEALALAIAKGDIGKAIKGLPWSKFKDILADALEERLGSYAYESAVPIQDLIEFKLGRESASAWAQQHTGDLIKDLTAESKEALRDYISQAAADGLAPGTITDQIRDVIGLTGKDAQAVETYRQELIDKWTQEKGVPDAEALDSIMQNVDDYISEKLDARAETIARTELTNAEARGKELAWEDAIDKGLIAEENIKITWHTEDEPCDECEPMDEMTITYDQDWPGGMEIPVHPNCRCTEEYEVLESSDDSSAAGSTDDESATTEDQATEE